MYLVLTFKFYISLLQAEDAKAMVNKPTGVVYDKRMVEHHCLWDENYPECPDRFTYVLSR